MRINDKMFVTNVEEGMILNYMSISEDYGINFFAIGIGKDSLQILERRFRTESFSWQNDDKTLHIKGEDDTMRLRFNNQKKHDVYLNKEESLRMKSILVPSH